MKTQTRDARDEHKPFDRSKAAPGRHPNKRRSSPHPVTGRKSRWA